MDFKNLILYKQNVQRTITALTVRGGVDNCLWWSGAGSSGHILATPRTLPSRAAGNGNKPE